VTPAAARLISGFDERATLALSAGNSATTCMMAAILQHFVETGKTDYVGGWR
jgi:hypothetical protein